MNGRYDAGLTRADLRSANLTDAACGRLESLYRPWSDVAGGGESEG
ncbi:hypothetical protein [Salinispora sp. H7-4]|nr:hypothetical protein [Salinispora sp. H7-4]NYT96733.1 hypothetical protein [Salinispora sp. H7-4]